MENLTLETHLRSVLKAISWRTGGTIVTFAVAWYVSGEINLAAKVGLLDTIIKVGAFYAHERLWHRVNFGRVKSPEYQI